MAFLVLVGVAEEAHGRILEVDVVVFRMEVFVEGHSVSADCHRETHHFVEGVGNVLVVVRVGNDLGVDAEVPALDDIVLDLSEVTYDQEDEVY